jgi:phasin family protein
MLTPEQLLTAQKANIETLLGLSGKAFEGVEKLVELNLQTAKAALGEAASTTQAALSVKNPQEWVALQTATLQPIADKAAAYGRQVYDIAASTGAEVAKVVEVTAADAQKKILAVVDTAVKNAPAGTENAVTFMKSAVAAANDAYENLQKVAKQATDAAEANLSAFSATTTKAAPANRSKRAA